MCLSIILSLCLGDAWATPDPKAEVQGQGANPAQAPSAAVGQSYRACGPGWRFSTLPDFSDPAYACGRCHAEQNRWVQRTLMATASGIINQTRYLWGAQPDAGPRYAAAALEGLGLLPTVDSSGALVDDLLRRRCLRCHLGSPAAIFSEGAKNIAGEGAACAACHLVNRSEGIAADQKLPEYVKEGDPISLTTAVPTSQCLHCHKGNRVGADYAGLFERDTSMCYNFGAQDPEIVPHLYDHSYHFLLPDIHYERGMHCIDCHPVEEVMGEGTIHAQSQDQVGVRCIDCHGRPGQTPRSRRVTATDQRALRAARANPHYDLKPGQRVIITSKGHLLANTREEKGKFLLISKVDGKIHQIPLLTREGSKTGPLDHRIQGHLQNMECAACHAAWTFQDLGLHLVRLDAADYDPWLWLTQQDDPQAQQFLRGELRKPAAQRNLPSSRDYLTGRSSPGLWLAGYSRRRWEGIVLGLNFRGLVSLFRPQYQYWVSQVDAEGRVLLNSAIPTTAAAQAALAWNPYTPHTVRRQTRACWDCHGNPGALGLGQMLLRNQDGQAQWLTRSAADGLGIEFELDQVVDGQGRPLQSTSRPGAAFFDKPRLERMSAHNPLYVKYLLEYYANKEAYGDPRGFTAPKK